jgi:hypothetical protein
MLLLYLRRRRRNISALPPYSSTMDVTRTTPGCCVDAPVFVLKEEDELAGLPVYSPLGCTVPKIRLMYSQK